MGWKEYMCNLLGCDGGEQLTSNLRNCQVQRENQATLIRNYEKTNNEQKSTIFLLRNELAICQQGLDSQITIALDLETLKSQLSKLKQPELSGDMVILSKGELKSLYQKYNFDYEFLDVEYPMLLWPDVLLANEYMDKVLFMIFKMNEIIESIIGNFKIPDSTFGLDDISWEAERRDCDNFGFFRGTLGPIIWGMHNWLPYWDYSGKHFYEHQIKIEEGKDPVIMVSEPQVIRILPIGQFPRDNSHRLVDGKLYAY